MFEYPFLIGEMTKEKYPFMFEKALIDIDVWNAIKIHSPLPPDKTPADMPDNRRDFAICYSRMVDKTSLQAIANIWDLSRERVRQIVVKSVGHSGKTFHPEPYRMDRMEPKGGAARIGYLAEEEVAFRFEEMGMKVERQLFNSSYDLLVNGHRVDVKFASKPNSSPTSRHISPQWRFSIHGERKNGDCDFYACLTAKQDLFVIPEGLVGEMSFLAFCYPNSKANQGKNWQSFLNRFDLLKGA